MNDDDEERFSKIERKVEFAYLLAIGSFIFTCIAIYIGVGAIDEMAEIMNDTIILDRGPAMYRPYENPLMMQAEDMLWENLTIPRPTP